MYWDNGKENGNYYYSRVYRGFTGIMEKNGLVSSLHKPSSDFKQPSWMGCTRIRVSMLCEERLSV